MLSIVIAEDEELIREGLLNNINWETLGLHVVGLAENGKEAIEQCRSHKPDILLTDIRMPIVNGLEVIKKVKAESEETSFIIISGYDDFEYAQSAIKLGVCDYFLKPIELEKIVDKLRSISSQILQDRMERENADHLQEFVKSAMPFLKRQYYLELIYGPYENRDIQSQLTDMGIVKSEDYYACVLVSIRIDKTGAGENGDIEAFYSPLLTGDSLNGEEVYLVKRFAQEATFIIIFSGGSSEALGVKVKSYKEAAQQLECVLFVTIGLTTPSLFRLHESFVDARNKLMLMRLFKDPNLGVDILDDEEKTLYNIDFAAIENAIKTGNKHQLKQQLSYIEVFISRDRQTDEYGTALLVNLFLSLNRLSETSGLGIDSFIENPLAPLSYNRNEPSYERVYRDLKTMAFGLMDFSLTKKDKSAKKLIGNAKEFIHQHYSEWDLSMENVAEFLDLNPSYFSSTFKAVEGVSYVEYVTNYRLQKAKELLLNNDVKISSVAHKIGYKNTAYFNYLFKRHVGVTPSAYRNSLPD